LLTTYGWSRGLQRDFAPHAARGLLAGRVIVQQRGLYRLATEAGEADAQLSGRFHHQAGEGEHPVAGDWVAAQGGDGFALIQAVLPRRTAFVRKEAGTAHGLQVVAANVDVALLTLSLNADLNLRRLERYLAATYESGAAPVVVLTKADQAADVAAATDAVQRIAGEAPVIAVSGLTGAGLSLLAEQLEPRRTAVLLGSSGVGKSTLVNALTGAGLSLLAEQLEPRRTAVLLGSSGVGKSTLVNALAGAELMAARAIREGDEKGRHTTTHRELIRLPSGALILDTPGMRELGLVDAAAGVAAVFGAVEAEVEALAAACRFNDCRHEAEPGCAVQAALHEGRLDPARYGSWLKLQRELVHERAKEDPAFKKAQQREWISRMKSARAWMKQKRKWE